jgi:hypothetical protein
MLLNNYLWRCLLDDGRLFTVAIIGVTRRAAVTVTAALAAALLAFISTVMVTLVLVLLLSSLIVTVAIKTF